MKNTLWTNHLCNSSVYNLNQAGFYTNEDFDEIPVLGLMLMKGIDYEEVEELLKSLFFEENTWRLRIKPLIMTATEKEGRKYMRDIFETYSFDEHPEYFYKMSVRELLDLDFIEERYIPFVISFFQKCIGEQEAYVNKEFSNRIDIKENFDEFFSKIFNPICDLYYVYGNGGYYDDDNNEDYYDEYDEYDEYELELFED